MNERQLIDRVFALAGRTPPGDEDASGASPRFQAPFVDAVFEVHPEGYEEARSSAVRGLLGEPDKIYRPALGVPHVDIYRYPPTPGREFWCYLSNGMSDFPQIDGDGGETRTELVTFTREASVLAVNLVHLLAARPFRQGRALRPEALELPPDAPYTGFRHVLAAPGGLLPSLDRIELRVPAMRIEVYAVTALSAEDFAWVRRRGVAEICAEVGVEPLFWLLDERFGLEPPSLEAEPAAEAATRGVACLEEATASPCPRCGGTLRQTRLADAGDPFLVCRACGWSRAESALEHIRPYRWALDRLRRELGADLVDWDVRPDGDGVVLRVNAPRRAPALVELRSPVYDINRSLDRERELEEKLERLRGFLAADSST